MEVCGQQQATATLPLEKGPQVPTVWPQGWSQQFEEKINLLALPGLQFHGHAVCTPVTAPTALSWPTCSTVIKISAFFNKA
jgi:hypothetical protein